LNTSHDVTETSALSELKRLAGSSRELFREILEMSINTRDTKGACLYASLMCSTALNKFTAAKVTIRGGDGEGDGGIFVDGVGHGHYWMEADVDGLHYIVDITGDQFGLPPLIVERVEVMAQIYVPGCQGTVDHHVAELMAEIAQEAAN
jgi:hypothetical protein